jgi:hypothetical protein
MLVFLPSREGRRAEKRKPVVSVSVARDSWRLSARHMRSNALK